MNKMTVAEIGRWCQSRVGIRRKDEMYDRGNTTVHDVEFVTGETYRHTEVNSPDRMHKKCTFTINGEQVNTTEYTWYNFGWRAIA